MRNKVMKNFINRGLAVVVSGSMLLALTGCGVFSLLKGEEDDSIGILETDKEYHFDISSVSNPSPDPEPTSEPSGDTNEGEEFALSLDSSKMIYDLGLNYEKNLVTEQSYPDDNGLGAPISEYRYETLKIDSESVEYRLLSDAIDEYSADLIERVENDYSGINEMAMEEYRINGAEDLDGYMPSTYFCIDESAYVRRVDEKVFSFIESYYSFSGGAHGYDAYTTYNYDVNTGELIGADEVFVGRMAGAEAITDKLLSKYGSDVFLYISSDSDESEYNQLLNNIYDYYLSPEAEYRLNYLIGYEGVYVYFNAYDISAYAFGTLEIFLPFAEYSGTVLSDKFTDIPDNYAYEMAGSPEYWNENNEIVTEYHALLGNSLEPTKISVSMEPEYSEDEAVEYHDITIKVGDYESTTENISSYAYTSYYVRTADGSYIYVVSNPFIGQSVVYIYYITDRTIRSLDTIEGRPVDFCNPLCFKMHHRSDLLSSYKVMGYYAVGDLGIPESFTNYYVLTDDNSPNLCLVSTQDIECEAFTGEDIEGVTVPTVVPSGTTFYFKYTDLKSYVIFETDSGNLVRMEAKSEDGVFNQSVNGVSVYELFEALWYAA